MSQGLCSECGSIFYLDPRRKIHTDLCLLCKDTLHPKVVRVKKIKLAKHRSGFNMQNYSNCSAYIHSRKFPPAYSKEEVQEKTKEFLESKKITRVSEVAIAENPIKWGYGQYDILNEFESEGGL